MKHKTYYSTDGFDFILYQDLSIENSKIVLSYRNHDQIRKWMFKPEKISFENHSQFIKKLDDREKVYLAVFRKEKIVACVNFHDIGGGKYFVGHFLNPKILFEDYMYVSGTSPVLVKHFENYFLKIKKSIKLDKKKDNILDIACNDGTFLNFFKKDKFKNVIGIEPAKNLRKLNKEKKIDINTDFFNYKSSSFSHRTKWLGSPLWKSNDPTIF